MPVSRISKRSIIQLMKGRVSVDDQTLCVIKFYSNGCHLCHALSTYYKDISDSEKYENVLFFAFNVDDDDEITQKLNLNGVPSITTFKINKGMSADISNLDDPDNPNNETWFSVKQITDFIDKGLK